MNGETGCICEGHIRIRCRHAGRTDTSRSPRGDRRPTRGSVVGECAVSNKKELSLGGRIRERGLVQRRTEADVDVLSETCTAREGHASISGSRGVKDVRQVSDTIRTEANNSPEHIRSNRKVLCTLTPSVLTSYPVVTGRRRGRVVAVVSVETDR